MKIIKTKDYLCAHFNFLGKRIIRLGIFYNWHTFGEGLKKFIYIHNFFYPSLFQIRIFGLAFAIKKFYRKDLDIN